MSKIRNLKAALDFLGQLREHNDRAWFEANRALYEEARSSFEGLVGDLISSFGPVDDLAGVSPKECIFRINRDVRFSKDKSPYKTAMGALMGSAGRKSGARSYYLHIEPEGGSMLAGGLYDPSSEELGKIRAALAEDSRPLKKILAAPEFQRHFGGISGESLKSAPQGYPKDHPEIELLRRKQFIAVESLDDETVASGDLVPLALKSYKAMKPFLLYLESALE
jgi:uncharacterized protein (TIGR02453 family)